MQNVSHKTIVCKVFEQSETGRSWNNMNESKDWNIFQWIGRTVMVQENNIDEAMQILNGIMAREGMTKRWRGTRVYEKPTWVGFGLNLKLF